MLLQQLWTGPPTQAAASLGRISFSSPQGYGAVSDAEVRDLPMAAPGGYAYRPRQGEELAVLHTQDGAVCVGMVAQAADLAPGEVRISGPGGSYLYFAQDGRVVINGLVISPQGELLIGGEEG